MTVTYNRGYYWNYKYNFIEVFTIVLKWLYIRSIVDPRRYWDSLITWNELVRVEKEEGFFSLYVQGTVLKSCKDSWTKSTEEKGTRGQRYKWLSSRRVVPGVLLWIGDKLKTLFEVRVSKVFISFKLKYTLPEDIIVTFVKFVNIKQNSLL